MANNGWKEGRARGSPRITSHHTSCAHALQFDCGRPPDRPLPLRTRAGRASKKKEKEKSDFNSTPEFLPRFCAQI